MKPTTILKGMIADMRNQGQLIDYELAERNTRAVVREQSFKEEQASRLVDGFQPNYEDTFLVGWPTTEEECPCAGLGTKCDPICVYCDMKHVCIDCALKPRSVEASIDPPCPLRIPGCRCSTGAGPSIFEYYCKTGDPFMGACVQHVQHTGDKEFLQQEIEDEEDFEEETGEEDVAEETDDDELLEDSGNERFFEEVGGEEILDDETEGEDFVDDKAPPLFSPPSLWPLPLSATFWNGLVPGWEQDLPASSQLQVDYNGYSDFLSGPSTMDPDCVAADRRARAGKAESSMDVLQLPIAYNGYSPFFPGSPGLTNQASDRTSPSAGKALSSGKPVRRESRPQASHEQGAVHKRATMGKDSSSQQPATKKDSRGWETHEKAYVKTLMLEVISEDTHARTEERWKVISKRLSDRYSIDRTWTAVKNYWNRQGRSETNIDERRVKKPDRMVTGVQDPESRRQARHLKRKDAERDNGNDLVDLVDLDDDESDSARLSKRQRP